MPHRSAKAFVSVAAFPFFAICASFHLGMKSFFGFPVGARLFFFCGAAPEEGLDSVCQK